MAKILLAYGDAEASYTEGKLLRLLLRLKKDGHAVSVVTNGVEYEKEAAKLGLPCKSYPFPHQNIELTDRIAVTKQMIVECEGLALDSLPLWKVMALDDFVGSIMLWGAFPAPTETIDADVVLLPFMQIDNNTRGTSGLYGWVARLAKEKGIPTIGLEVSPIGNKNTLSHIPVDIWAVRSHYSRQFLIATGKVKPEQIYLLRADEQYLLRQGGEAFYEGCIQAEDTLRTALQVPRDGPVYFLPHHVGFMYETRRMLEELVHMPPPFSVVIRVDGKVMRRQHTEKDIVVKQYGEAMQKLPRVIIDDGIAGPGLLVNFADAILSTYAGSCTEYGMAAHKPTIIHQAGCQQRFNGDFCAWLPDACEIPSLLKQWDDMGMLRSYSVGDLVNRVTQHPVQVANGLDQMVRRGSPQAVENLNQTLNVTL